MKHVLTWKWLLLFVVLTVGFGWALMTSASAETFVANGGTEPWLTGMLRYVFPFALLLAVALWLNGLFSVTPSKDSVVKEII